jgi:hypothetical protein
MTYPWLQRDVSVKIRRADVHVRQRIFVFAAVLHFNRRGILFRPQAGEGGCV